MNFSNVILLTFCHRFAEIVMLILPLFLSPGPLFWRFHFWQNNKLFILIWLPHLFFCSRFPTFAGCYLRWIFDFLLMPERVEENASESKFWDALKKWKNSKKVFRGYYGFRAFRLSCEMFAASSNILAVFVGIFTVPFYIAYMLFTYRPTNRKMNQQQARNPLCALWVFSHLLFLLLLLHNRTNYCNVESSEITTISCFSAGSSLVWWLHVKRARFHV